MDSALASNGPVLEPAGIDSDGGRFCHLLTEATPAALLLPKTCHINPIEAVTHTSDLSCSFHFSLPKFLPLAVCGAVCLFFNLKAESSKAAVWEEFVSTFSSQLVYLFGKQN